MYVRICPNCSKVITYKSYGGWHTACKTNQWCRNCASYKRTKHYSDLSVLLKETPEAYYWIGFLLADGSFNKHRISLGLSIKDKVHLLKFVEFIKFTGTLDETDIKCTVRAMDNKIVPKIMHKFDIKNRKTYNPPQINFTQLNKNLLLSLICGFIDGDGCIKYQFKRKDFVLTIKCHASWLNILNQFGKILGDETHCKLNSAGYAVLNITNTKLLKQLKLKVLSLNLPLLTRKWDRIDLNFRSKYEIAEELRQNVFKEFRLNILSKTDIAKKYNTSNANITKLYKKYETTTI